MNVYFIDPKYIKPESWKPLLTYLKVKAAYSFIPTIELPTALLGIIQPYLTTSYSNQNFKSFCDNCAFWLRVHFEKYVRLITKDFQNVQDIPKETLKKYSSHSAFNNIANLDDENCLILLNFVSDFDELGRINPPHCYVKELRESNLPTHVAKYCLNILHKKYGHNQYENQTAFICFDSYFSRAFYYTHKNRSWNSYTLRSSTGKYVAFIQIINQVIHKKAPELFPLVEVNGKRHYTLLRSAEGEAEYQQLLNEAQEARREYEELFADDGWQNEVAKMNRDFWEECGEAGSNCESWPGWD